MSLDIIIFAAIAAFIVLRLRSVLGRRTGNEKPPPASVENGRGERNRSGNIISLPEIPGREPAPDLAYEKAPAGSPLRLGFDQIKKADKSFNADEFLKGASAAFEMIIQAFARGDMTDVGPYLSRDVLDNFSRAILARKGAGDILETTIIGIKSSEILEARMEGRNALLTTKFVSEQVNVTRSTGGKIKDGDPDKITEVVDIWIFTRNTQDKDPNWILVETRSPN